MSPLDLPVSVLLALWAPLPSSIGLALVQGPDAVHEVADPGPGGLGLVSLEAWLARTGALRRCAAVLPSPADPLPGLAAALEAGEGVLVETATRRLLLVPQPSGASVRWQAEELTAVVPPCDAAHARRATYQATEEAITALTELDLARERPDLAEELTDLITAVLDPRLVPPSLEPRRRELLERSLRLAAICELALSDDGAAATAAQAQRRRQVLRPLLAVARQGVAAATESWAVAA
ncbi:MAG: hypothetical protein SO046_03060 [Actinomyces urogenitalis]|uniref:hypothetical protein n=1 Tax=Actinomyces urogenitalis TaxID=103621 RepID=UPI002A803B97|nr:hypothetical protein [Actinomyces urogenitalis]MDY3678184.1 hypothetical protein [Actinomyces urogenitalis]